MISKKNRTISKKISRNSLWQWTLPNVYKTVQNMRRLGTTNAQQQRTNAALRSYFRTYAARAPALPPGIGQPPLYLWRGVHGILAKKLLEDGVVDEKGYISVSRSMDVANKFRENLSPGILLKIKRESIPISTPWVWFDTRKIRSSIPDEQEVLLPPGKIVLVNELRHCTRDSLGLGELDTTFVTSVFTMWYVTQRGRAFIHMPPTHWRIREETDEYVCVTPCNTKYSEVSPFEWAAELEYILGRVLRRKTPLKIFFHGMKTTRQELNAVLLEVLLKLASPVRLKIDSYAGRYGSRGCYSAVYVPDTKSGMMEKHFVGPLLNSRDNKAAHNLRYVWNLWNTNKKRKRVNSPR